MEGAEGDKEDEGTGSLGVSVPHLAKDQRKSPYAKMREDVTKSGCEILAKTYIVAVREEKRRILEQKNLLRECIVHYLSHQAVNNLVHFFEPSSHVGVWQCRVGKTKNNLQLTI